MPRPLELIWAAAFGALAAGAIVAQFPSWRVVFGVSFLLTFILTTIESRRPCYHGIGWRWVNPRLPAWWADGAR